MTLAESANANLLATYLAVGRALPGAEIRKTPGYVALLSDLPHPSGNFAARLDLDPWCAAGLRDLAASRPAFQAVALPGDGPAHLSELLRRAGFEAVQTLLSLVAEPYSTPSDLDMTSAEGAEERLRAGRFMSDAFFFRESAPIREALAVGLAQTTALTASTHLFRERPVAAVALSRTEGMLGLYNVCVAPPFRGRGLGRNVVGWALAQAAAEHRSACLQCVPALETWYARLGFVRAGTITAWALASR